MTVTTMGFDRKFLNILGVGLAFMLLFTAIQTLSIIEKTVLESVQAEDPSFTGDAYTSLAIMYGTFSVSNWVAPSVISLVTPKWSMVLGAGTYLLLLAAFLKPITWLLYLLAVLMGFGSALLWIGHGNFFTLNSDDENMGRNSGIFWTMFQASLLFGNLFVYFEFEGETIIGKSTRTTVFLVLLGVAFCGLLVFCVLRSVTDGSSNQTSTPSLASSSTTIASSKQLVHLDAESSFVDEQEKKMAERQHNANNSLDDRGPLEALKAAARLFVTPDMARLSLTFVYTGVELAFYSGVYSGAVGFTRAFGEDRAKYVGISGMLMGVGEITGGLLSGFIAMKVAKNAREYVVLLGAMSHLVAGVLTVLNLPNDSVFGQTSDSAFIESRLWIAFVCSFLLGFADACIQTQLYATLGSLYADDSAPAFALYQFAQCVAASVAFIYSSFIGLHYQLIILGVCSLIGTTSFWTVSWKHKKVI